MRRWVVPLLLAAAGLATSCGPNHRSATSYPSSRPTNTGLTNTKPSYTAVEIVVPPATADMPRSLRPIAVNERGQVCLVATRSNGDRSPVSFVWSAGKAVQIPPLPGGRWVEARSMNADGSVVGHAFDRPVGHTRPFLWRQGRPSELPWPSRTECSASTIDDGETVTGRGWLPDGWHLVVWRGGKLDVRSGTMGCEVYGTNRRGQTVGWTWRVRNGPSYAAIWTNGRMQVLEGVGANARAVSISEAGTVVGDSSVRPSVGVDAMARHGFVWDKGKCVDMGTLGGRDSQACDINNGGQVVGLAYTAQRNVCRAAIWDRTHGLRDLNTLVTMPDGLLLTCAYAVNDRGQIACTASPGRRLSGPPPTRVFLLTPLK